MFSGMRRKLARRAVEARRMHCFCLGAAKTGTTSVAAMFGKWYRSAHEPEVTALTDAVAGILGDGAASEKRVELGSAETEVPSFDVAEWLQARDQRLNLEVEASHPLGYMAPWLPQVFPDARFIITVRDPRAWLKSRLNFHLYKSPPQWQKYRDLIWSRWHTGYHREEMLLETMGLYSIDAYLSQYSEQYQLLLKHLPEHRRLLVRTEELDTSSDRMGDFLAIDPATITRQHANSFTRENSVLDQLPREFVALRIAATCGWMKGIL